MRRCGGHPPDGGHRCRRCRRGHSWCGGCSRCSSPQEVFFAAVQVTASQTCYAPNPNEPSCLIVASCGGSARRPSPRWRAGGPNRHGLNLRPHPALSASRRVCPLQKFRILHRPTSALVRGVRPGRSGFTPQGHRRSGAPSWRPPARQRGFSGIAPRGRGPAAAARGHGAAARPAHQAAQPSPRGSARRTPESAAATTTAAARTAATTARRRLQMPSPRGSA